MQTSTVLILGAGAVALGGVYLLTRPAAPLPGGQPSPGNSGWSSTVGSIENYIQGKTGVPVASIGTAAQRAPTWLKVAVLPVGVTAVAQGLVTHPVDTVKSAAKTVSHAASSVGHFLGF